VVVFLKAIASLFFRTERIDETLQSAVSKEALELKSMFDRSSNDQPDEVAASTHVDDIVV
jgi:hypothetical protein